MCLLPVGAKAKIKGNKYGATRSAGDYRRKVQLALAVCVCVYFLIVGGFYSEVALQKREAEGTVHTEHQLNLDPNPEGT